MYFRTLVLNTNKIVIMRDVYSRDSLGGGGASSWDPCNPTHTAEFAAHHLGLASCFWTFVTNRKAVDTHWWRSLTGVMPPHIPVEKSVADDVKWEGCGGFQRHWGYAAHYMTDHSLHKRYVGNNNMADRKHNVICMQDFQMKYTSATNSYSELIVNAVSKTPLARAVGERRE